MMMKQIQRLRNSNLLTSGWKLKWMERREVLEISPWLKNNWKYFASTHPPGSWIIYYIQKRQQLQEWRHMIGYQLDRRHDIFTKEWYVDHGKMVYMCCYAWTSSTRIKIFDDFMSRPENGSLWEMECLSGMRVIRYNIMQPPFVGKEPGILGHIMCCTCVNSSLTYCEHVL